MLLRFSTHDLPKAGATVYTTKIEMINAITVIHRVLSWNTVFTNSEICLVIPSALVIAVAEVLTHSII